MASTQGAMIRVLDEKKMIWRSLRSAVKSVMRLFAVKDRSNRAKSTYIETDRERERERERQ